MIYQVKPCLSKAKMLVQYCMKAIHLRFKSSIEHFVMDKNCDFLY